MTTGYTCEEKLAGGWKFVSYTPKLALRIIKQRIVSAAKVYNKDVYHSVTPKYETKMFNENVLRLDI